MGPSPSIATTSAPGELFGVHVPELQLGTADLRAAMRAAGLSAGDTYVELGSGHGRGLVMAAAEFGAYAHGVEYVDDAIEATHAAAARSGVDVRVDRADLAGFDTSHANVVLIHLGPAFHDVLAERLQLQLQPDARVIAAGWRVPGWLPLVGSPQLDAYDTGYVYRPADPTRHASWTRVPGPKVAELHMHAELTELEIRIDGVAGACVDVSATRAGRGQTLLVDVPDGATTLECWARSPGGRFARRGDMLELTSP